MKILFIGDIVGEPGRRAVHILLPRLRKHHAVDFVIANGENSAGGNGITPRLAAELFGAGIDVLTSGDHLWDQKEVLELLRAEPRFLRPVNYPEDTPGRGAGVFTVQSPSSAPGRLVQIAVLNAQGRAFMTALDNPFRVVPPVIARLRAETNIIFVDFHAEATSEKIAFARLLDGTVSAVVGTHTHVQTADEQILPGGTAYLSDAGFTGPHESVLGREIAPVIQRFVTNMPQRFEVAKHRVLLHGALVTIEVDTGCASRIERISEPL
ncbi:MAG TPA: TIGR00282 family metallophosphoesterase [Verrucomicrobiota bacterium]|nr:TIGR00282 family metallophosphoesterase [Verrucomicrobiota bacterium]HNT15975.1 TIGR00282 family metallophosphoesterase [Verrucomicrobiota bacterium]